VRRSTTDARLLTIDGMSHGLKHLRVRPAPAGGLSRVSARLLHRGLMTRTILKNGAMSRQAVWAACGVYLVWFLSTSVEFLNPIRYVIYTTPLILMGSLFYERMPKSNTSAEAYFLIYLSMGFIAYLIGIQHLGYFMNEFIIMALVALYFVPLINVSKTQIRVIFLFSAACLFFAYSFSEHRGVRVLEMFEGTIAPDESGFGHSVGLVAPIYTVFFFAVGAKIEFTLAVIMSFLGGKRIGLLAILVGLVSLYLFRRVAFLQNRGSRFLILLAALAAINIAAVNLVTIAGYAYSEARQDADIEEIMLGRYAIGTEMSRAMENRSWLQSTIGSGPGSALVLTGLVSGGFMKETHNDWLKIIFDYGILGSSLITIFMALIFSSSRTGPAIALASAVIMMTDNVTIYLFYQFPIALMVAYSRLHDSQRAETGNAPEAGLAHRATSGEPSSKSRVVRRLRVCKTDVQFHFKSV
jgi:hypothetical protein